MTCSRSVPSSSQMTKVRWTPSSSRPSSAGPAPGEVRTATLVWARQTLTARRRVRRVGDHDLGVVPGHPGAGEGGGDRGDGGYDLDLQAELGVRAGCVPRRRSRGRRRRGRRRCRGGRRCGGRPGRRCRGGSVRRPAVLRGARGGGRRRPPAWRRDERGAGRGGQRRAVPADHRDPVGHRRQSPGVCSQGVAEVRAPRGEYRWLRVVWCAAASGSTCPVPVAEVRGKPSASAQLVARPRRGPRAAGSTR